MTMEIKKDDYIIVEDDGKTKMIRVNSVKKGLIQGVTEDDTDEQEDLEVSADDVVANLGLSPKIGKVYLSNTERLITIEEHDFWGEVHWLFSPSDEVKEAVGKALDSAAKKLKAKHLTSWRKYLKCVRLRYLLNNPKHLGLYKAKGKSTPDEPLDEIHIRVNEVTVSVMEEVLIHEACHGIDTRMLHNEKARRAWLRHFTSLTKTTRYEEDEVQALVDKMLEDKSFENFSEDEYEVLKSGPVGDFLSATATKEKDFLLLLDGSNSYIQSQMGSYVRAVTLTEQTTDSTEYSKTNVAEYFAETVSGHVFYSKTLSDKTEALIEKTLDALEG